MTKPALLLAVSVTLNLVLGGAILQIMRLIAPLQDAPPDPPPALSLPSSAPPAPEIPVPAFSWNDWRNENLAAYAQNLRDAGCPEETIQAILFHEIDTLFAARREALAPADYFWEQNGPERARRELSRLEWELRLEQRELIREVLGIEWHPVYPSEDFHSLAEQFNFVPEEIAIQAANALSRYFERTGELMSEAEGLVLPTDVAQINTAFEDLMNEWNRNLTPEQLEELEARLWTELALDVWSLEEQFGNRFTPEEAAQFARIKSKGRTVHDFFLTFFEGPAQRNSPEFEQWQHDQIRALLGEERFQGYLRAQNSEFRGIHRTLCYLDLPMETTWAVFDIHQIARTEAERARTDPGLNPDQIAWILREIRTETERALQQSLGNHFEEYLQDARGRLDRLQKP